VHVFARLEGKGRDERTWWMLVTGEGTNESLAAALAQRRLVSSTLSAASNQ